MPPTIAFEGTETEFDTRNRTLRLALAMRGGVSLAVWIGGAVAEIDLFRRACAGEIHPEENDFRQARARCYRQLLATTAFSRVEIDILAGASAGGLNAILYGLSQSCTTVMDEAVRETWIKQGGIWELLRDKKTLKSTASSSTVKKKFWGRILRPFPDRRVPSILQGDERLYAVARNALALLAGQDIVPRAEHPPLEYTTSLKSGERPPITVELAATLLDDPIQPSAGNRAGFSFRKTAGTLASRFSTIPDRAQINSDEGQRALDRMAMAARSTSSFPGAFEPASIKSVSYLDTEAPVDPYVPDLGSADTEAEVDVNMARVYPHARVRTSLGHALSSATSESYGVVDGGIFDNIPIDRAIRAIQRAPSSQPSERRLVYVDPEPPTQTPVGASVPDRPTATSWVPVIRSSLALKQRNEAAADELDILRLHNDDVLQRRGRLEALAAFLSQIPIPRTDSPGATSGSNTTLPSSIAVSESAYRQSRIAQDAARIATLLTDPRAELCQPPRPAVDFVPLQNIRALKIKNELGDAYNAMPEDWTLSNDIYAHLDGVRVLMTWTHELETLTEALRKVNSPIETAALSNELRSFKRTLYCYVAVLVEAKHLAIDAILADPLRASHSPHDPDNYALEPLLEDSRDAQDALCIPTELTDLMGWGPSHTEFYTALRQWISRPLAGEPFLLTIGNGLQALRKRLGETSLTVVERTKAQHPEERETQPWRESVFNQFYRSDFQDVTLTELTKLFSVTGTPVSSIIAFELINSAAEPQIDIPLLKRGAQAQYLLNWVNKKPTAAQVARTVTDATALQGPEAKLAGNVLSRFGGFFSARWRENDWQWGRLDAAAGIAKMIDALKPSPHDAAPPLESLQINDRIKCLQTSILEESKFTTGTPEDQPAIVQSVGAETFDVITPHYRFALASRAVPLVLRALIPPRESASLLSIVRHLAIIVARPLLIPVTLAADPLRLVLAFVVIVVSAGLLGTSPLEDNSQKAFAIVLMVAGALIGFRAFRTHKKWNDVGTLLGLGDNPNEASPASAPPPPPPPGGGDYGSWQTMFRAARPTLWIALSAALAIVVCLFGLLRLVAMSSDDVPPILPESLPIEAVALVLSVVVGLQHWFNARCYTINPERSAVGWKAKVPQFFSASSRTVGRGFKFRSPEQSRIVRVVLSAVALVLALAGYLISTQASSADFFHDEVQKVTDFLREGDAVATTRAGEIAATWAGDVAASRAGGVAAVTVLLLSLISLWGWARNLWAVGIAVVAGIIAGLLQFTLDWAGPWSDYVAFFDLLPALVWMVILGLIVQIVPHRESDLTKFAVNTSFGEKNRPVVKPCYRETATTAATDAEPSVHDCVALVTT